MSFVIALVLLSAGACAVSISVGVFLLVIKRISLAFVMGFLLTGLAIAGAVAWQAGYSLLGIVLVALACVTGASTIAVSARGSGN
jgi:hypothetical protein